MSTIQDAVTITPAHIWAVVEFDLGSDSLTEQGNAEYSKLVHRYLTQHTIKSTAQWGMYRGLVKIRNTVAEKFAAALRDIIDVNVTERVQFDRDAFGLEKIPRTN